MASTTRNLKVQEFVVLKIIDEFKPTGRVPACPSAVIHRDAVWPKMTDVKTPGAPMPVYEAMTFLQQEKIIEHPAAPGSGKPMEQHLRLTPLGVEVYAEYKSGKKRPIVEKLATKKDLRAEVAPDGTPKGERFLAVQEAGGVMPAPVTNHALPRDEGGQPGAHRRSTSVRGRAAAGAT